MATAQKKPIPAQKKFKFKTNEFIVYPAHGVGKIVSIEEQIIAGAKLELYVVDFLKEKMRLRVPTAKCEAYGMRKLAEKPLVEQALKVLRAVRGSSAPCGRAGRRNMKRRSTPVI
jgi:CarD family transcriptional regulator